MGEDLGHLHPTGTALSAVEQSDTRMAVSVAQVIPVGLSQSCLICSVVSFCFTAAFISFSDIGILIRTKTEQYVIEDRLLSTYRVSCTNTCLRHTDCIYGSVALFLADPPFSPLHSSVSLI